MSFAEDILSGRRRKVEETSRAQYAEGARIVLEKFEADMLQRRVLAEKAELERQETECEREKAILDERLDLLSPVKSTTALHGVEEVGVAWWRLFGRPWTFVWRIVLILGLVSAVLLGVVVQRTSDLHWLYAAVMAACVPVTIVVFFAELARRVDLSWVFLALVFVFGGIASISLTLFVNNCVPALTKSATWAGVIEEPCKGAILLVLFTAFSKFRNTLSGLAFGAAVGAGFASIETYSYAYGFGANGMPSTGVLVLRGALAPLMHTSWTTALGGAMFYTVNIRDISEKRIPRVMGAIGVFVLMICCHCIWNSAGAVGYLPMIVWALIFYYVGRGVSELGPLGKETPR